MSVLNARLVRLLLAPFFALGLVTVLLLAAHPALAATINVTTTADEDAVDNGDCSLREALDAARTDTAVGGCTAGSGADTISLPAGTYVLTTGSPLGTGRHDFTLQGAGRDVTFIEAAPGTTNRLLVVGVTGTVMINDVTFRGSQSSNESAILVNTSSNLFVTLDNSAIMSNTAGGISAGAPMTIANTLIRGNTSTQGCAGVSGGPMLTILDSEISQNVSTDEGGGICAGNLDLRNSRITDNRSTFGGGLLIGLGGEIFIDNTIFARNVATPTYGGGAALILPTGTIQNSTFQENIAGDSGGGLGFYGLTVPGLFDSNLTISNTRVISNMAKNAAGIGNAGAMTVVNSYVGGNVATDLGGGIGNDSFVYSTPLASGITSTLQLENTTIENNSARRGGGIANGGILTMTGSTAQNNQATERGGGITVGNGIVQVADSTVRGNQAPTGGGIFVTYESRYGSRSTQAQLIDSAIRDNQGSGLAVEGGTVGLQGTTFSGQTGGNCDITGGTVTSQGGNTSSDSSCASVLDAPGDQNGDDPSPAPDNRIFLPSLLRPPAK